MNDSKKKDEIESKYSLLRKILGDIFRWEKQEEQRNTYVFPFIAVPTYHLQKTTLDFILWLTYCEFKSQKYCALPCNIVCT